MTWFKYKKIKRMIYKAMIKKDRRLTFCTRSQKKELAGILVFHYIVFRADRKKNISNRDSLKEFYDVAWDDFIIQHYLPNPPRRPSRPLFC